jgi:uncharacterized delta-60 repeat protein
MRHLTAAMPMDRMEDPAIPACASSVAQVVGPTIRGSGCARRNRFAALALAFIALICCLGLAATAHAAPGDLDLSFSGDGKLTTDFGATESGTAVAVQADGRIVQAGEAGGGNLALARYGADGTLDPSFSSDGKLTTTDERFRLVEAVAVQADGKIIVAGGSGSSDGFVLARFNADGTPDGSFAGDGRQITRFGGGDGGFATALVVQPDGRIVVAGVADSPTGNDDERPYRFALARYMTDGTLDPSFAGDGRQTTKMQDDVSNDFGRALALQADGKIILAGDTANGSSVAVARYRTDGFLDASFSEDGRQQGAPGGPFSANSVAVQPDGRIVIAGPVAPLLPGGEFGIARYRTDGEPDRSFSSDGGLRSDFGAKGSARGVVVQPDGRIVVGGSSSGDFALARYDPAGTLDSSFAADGKQTTDFGVNAFGSAVALQPDGNIIVAGAAGAGEAAIDAEDFALARYERGPLSPLATLGVPPFAAKLEIRRARVLRSARRLSVLAPITARASGRVEAEFFAAGRTERFQTTVDARNRRVRIDRRIPRRQAALGTGILTLSYRGDGDTQPQQVRLRAASRKANLRAERPKITAGRLTASGRLSSQARGIVRLQLLYEPPGLPTLTLEFTTPIRNGRYEFDVRLRDDVVAQIAARRGVVHSYTLFTGYFPKRVRGEMRSYQVMAAP